MRNCLYLLLLVGLICPTKVSSYNRSKKYNIYIERARQMLDSLYKYYGIPNSFLLRENYPFEKSDKVIYLALQNQKTNEYSYLWPFSGTFSAVNALYCVTEDKYYFKLLNNKILVGLDAYFDDFRRPAAYASYIIKAGNSDRFYDDNVWVGIDFTDLYLKTGKRKYEDKAKMIWHFIESGIDNRLGGELYWCEQKKESKNACSNAPASVLALKLFMATSDSLYFREGKELYGWTASHLKDDDDGLYYDNISLNGHVDKTKYAYNSGQMLQASVLLYRLTKDSAYLHETKRIAEACYRHFFFHKSNGNIILKGENVWFSAVMLRGFIELYNIDHQKKYIKAFRNTLDVAWNNARDANGLFNCDYTGKVKDKEKWLLTQAAYVEMYARLAMLRLN